MKTPQRKHAIKKKHLPTKAEIEAAKLLADDLTRILRANERLWMDEWNAAPNPFVAIKRYCFVKNRAIRRRITKPALAAQAAYEAIRPSTPKF